MRKLALLAVLLLSAVAARADGAFLSGISDLPLMPGLTEDADGAMVFDTPEGRIAHVAAKGKAKAGDILSFYGETLPQLGWTSAGKGRFSRENELLTISVRNVSPGIAETVFEIAPAKSK